MKTISFGFLCGAVIVGLGMTAGTMAAPVEVAFEGIVTNNSTSYSDIETRWLTPRNSNVFGTISYDDNALPRPGTSNMYSNAIRVELRIVGAGEYVWTLENGVAAVFNDVPFDTFEAKNNPLAWGATVSGPPDGSKQPTYFLWHVDSGAASTGSTTPPLSDTTLPTTDELLGFSAYDFLEFGMAYGYFKIGFNEETEIFGVLGNMSAVPLPGAVWLFAPALALLGLAGRSRPGRGTPA